MDRQKRYVKNLMDEMRKYVRYASQCLHPALRGNERRKKECHAALTKAEAMIVKIKTEMDKVIGPRPVTPKVESQEGAWSTYQSFLASTFWKELRAKALAFSENRCQVCNREGQLNVHHRRYTERWGQETMSDVIVLCPGCHQKFHQIKTSVLESGGLESVDLPKEER